MHDISPGVLVDFHFFLRIALLGFLGLGLRGLGLRGLPGFRLRLLLCLRRGLLSILRVQRASEERSSPTDDGE